jgi:hypothetical protein
VWMVSSAGKAQFDWRRAAFNRVLSSHSQMLSKNMVGLPQLHHAWPAFAIVAMVPYNLVMRTVNGWF